MAQHTSVLNLEYSFLVEPKSCNPGSSTYFESNTGLWTEYVNDNSNYKMIDNLLPIQKVASQINKKSKSAADYITVTDPSSNNQLITLALQGSLQFVEESRTQLLKSYNQVNFKSIHLSNAEFLRIDQKFTTYIMEICSRYQVEIVLNSEKLKSKPLRTQLNDEFWLHIIGYQDNVTLAEPSLRILISNILNCEHLDSVDIELSLIPLMGGADLFNFNQIADQSNANIYIPDLLPNLFNSNILNNTHSLKILITAKSIPEIILTKTILSKLVNSANGRDGFVVKEIDMQRPKIDCLILYNQSELLNIMFKYGVFIQLPSLGENDNFKCIVQGTNLTSVNDAIDEINVLSCNYYCLQVNSSTDNSEQIFFLTQLIQLKKTCSINANRFGMEITGKADEIKQILNQFASNSMSPYSSVKLRLELSNSQRDFISGKKNGKLIKILNQLNQVPIIKFKPFNEYNFFIDFEIQEGVGIMVLLKGLELIELELPAELQFNVPEVFHKSIIGNGGSIIQSIMKKYNVFIKFSSTNVNNDTDDRNMYTFMRFNNVLIKCPRKNSKNIGLVKNEIDQMVRQCCTNSSFSMSPVRGLKSPMNSGNTTIYYTVKFRLLKSHYLLLTNNNKLKAICDLEVANSSFLDFPDSLDAFKSNDLVVEIKGSESKTRQCFEQLKDLMPQNYEFKITFMPGKFEEFLSKAAGAQLEEFTQRVVIPFKILLGIELVVNETPINIGGNENDSNTSEEYHQIILSYFPESAANLESAIHDLTLYLREKGFLILEKKTIEFNPLIYSPGSNRDSIGLLPAHQFALSPQQSIGSPQQQQYINNPLASPSSQYNTYLSPVPFSPHLSPQQNQQNQQNQFQLFQQQHQNQHQGYAQQLLSPHQMGSMMPLVPIHLNGSPVKAKNGAQRKGKKQKQVQVEPVVQYQQAQSSMNSYDRRGSNGQITGTPVSRQHAKRLSLNNILYSPQISMNPSLIYGEEKVPRRR